MSKCVCQIKDALTWNW